MKKIGILLLSIMLIAGCGMNSAKTDQKKDADISAETAKVIIYYFHGKQRCPTCLAVQRVSEETYKEYFADNQDVIYKEIDMSEKENEALAETYEVYFSSLIITTPDLYKDLTESAFANAVNNPQIFKDLIVTEVKSFLN